MIVLRLLRWIEAVVEWIQWVELSVVEEIWMCFVGCFIFRDG